jgi:hypothetical protein
MDQKCIIASSDLGEAEVIFAEAYSATDESLRKGQGLRPQDDYFPAFVSRLIIRAQLLIPR